MPSVRDIRWLRQSISSKRAKLELYVYEWPIVSNPYVPFRTATADEQGHFDFGTVPKGHYSLAIHDEERSVAGWFDVEIVGPDDTRESILIDVSPTYPDCTGGHEFTVNK